MIHIEVVKVSGTSLVGAFEGCFVFKEGLQIVSADNHFGKSLAVTSIAWCLGLERMFGLQDNDPSRFPMAVREVIDLNGKLNVPVVSSQSALTLRRNDGAALRLTREILGDPANVLVEEMLSDGTVFRSSRLLARKQTMKDETAGLQNFLFTWFDLPRCPVMTNRGGDGELYLENIAPLFFIDQSEGWTDIQSLQVHRYGLLDVSEIAVEYLLGALAAIKHRFSKQIANANEARMKADASAISSSISEIFRRNGWIVDAWTDHGTITNIANRWREKTLIESLKSLLNIDLSAQQLRLRERAVKLRLELSQGKLDPSNAAGPSDISQNVVELKDIRHRRREELRTLRRQQLDQQDLLINLEHRIHSARDVLRLKKDGIGRIETFECPTCHRALHPSTFQLTSQATDSVEAHIAALQRDRILVVANRTSSENQIIRLTADLANVEIRLREAERALGTVNQTIGASREQLAKIATELASTEAEIERTAETVGDLLSLQARVSSWLEQAGATQSSQIDNTDLDRRVQEFSHRLAGLLVALGHSAILSQIGSGTDPDLDEDYIPYLGPRRLRSLGSASDQSRLVAAYVLALAEASETLAGLHPGFVVLDEPLQQNPDEAHRKLFIDFLKSGTARKLKGQTIIFTWLHAPELTQLREEGLNVITPQGEHFLHSVDLSNASQ